MVDRHAEGGIVEHKAIIQRLSARRRGNGNGGTNAEVIHMIEA